MRDKQFIEGTKHTQWVDKVDEKFLPLLIFHLCLVHVCGHIRGLEGHLQALQWCLCQWQLWPRPLTDHLLRWVLKLYTHCSNNIPFQPKLDIRKFRKIRLSRLKNKGKERHGTDLLFWCLVEGENTLNTFLVWIAGGLENYWVLAGGCPNTTSAMSVISMNSVLQSNSFTPFTSNLCNCSLPIIFLHLSSLTSTFSRRECLDPTHNQPPQSFPVTSFLTVLHLYKKEALHTWLRMGCWCCDGNQE